MKNILYFLVPLVILSSCATLKISDNKTVAIDNNVIQYPTVADLEIGANSINSSVEWKEKWFGRGIPFNIRKGNLIAEMALQAKADILTDPRVIFEKGNSGFRSRKLTIPGFPARYKNFRPATKKDIEAIYLLSPYTTRVKTYDTKLIQCGDIKNLKKTFHK